jgi:hypothetical protein
MRVLGVRIVSGAGWVIDRAHSKRAKARQSGLRMEVEVLTAPAAPFRVQMVRCRRLPPQKL